MQGTSLHSVRIKLCKGNGKGKGKDKGKGKNVKCTLVQALRPCTGRTAHRRSRGIALLFLDHGTRRDEVSASRPDRSLPPRKTRYPFYRRLGGPGAGLDRCG